MSSIANDTDEWTHKNKHNYNHFFVLSGGEYTEAQNNHEMNTTNDHKETPNHRNVC